MARSIFRPNRELIRPKSATRRKLTRRSAQRATRFALPESLRATLNPDEFRLYDMIWKRTVACQMADICRGHRITVCKSAVMGLFSKPGGKTIEFSGYLRAYVEGADDQQPNSLIKRRFFPSFELGQAIDLRELLPKDHTTQPPFRDSAKEVACDLGELADRSLTSSNGRSRSAAGSSTVLATRVSSYHRSRRRFARCPVARMFGAGGLRVSRSLS